MRGHLDPLATVKHAVAGGFSTLTLLATTTRLWWARKRGLLTTATGGPGAGTVPRMKIQFWRIELPSGGAFYACSEPCARMVIDRPWTPGAAAAAHVELASTPTRCCHCAACAELIVWPEFCALHEDTPEGCPETAGALTVWVWEACKLWITIRRCPPTLEQIAKWAVYAAEGETNPAALIRHV